MCEVAGEGRDTQVGEYVYDPFYTCKDIRRFYDDFAHEEIKKEKPEHALDGAIFRKDPVDIESESGKIIHRGLSPEAKVIETMDAALKILHSQDSLFWFAWDYFIISLLIFIHSTMAMGERIGLLLPIF